METLFSSPKIEIKFSSGGTDPVRCAASCHIFVNGKEVRSKTVSTSNRINSLFLDAKKLAQEADGIIQNLIKILSS